jgi:hypothetical protein
MGQGNGLRQDGRCFGQPEFSSTLSWFSTCLLGAGSGDDVRNAAFDSAIE